jgi:hypothetical protein
MENIIDVLDPSGHVSLTWHQDDEESVKAARKEFNRLKKMGFAFFITGKPTETATQVKTFDDALEALNVVAPTEGKKDKKKARRGVAIPRMRGG